MTTELQDHKVVSEVDWIAARKELLRKEKEVTQLRDQLSAERRELPWVKVGKNYEFDGPDGRETLADLFDGRSQLFVKHFMLAPGQETQCVGCSFEVDHIGGILVHLEHHDVSYVAVARAPLAEIEVMKKRMSWRFKWVSSFGSDHLRPRRRSDARRLQHPRLPAHRPERDRALSLPGRLGPSPRPLSRGRLRRTDRTLPLP